MIGKLLISGLIFISSSKGIFENCDYYEEVVPNKSYFLYSPEYPDKYPAGKTCRWYLVSPKRTKIGLTCEDFYVPPSQNCHLDKLGISRKGRIDLNDVEYFCGQGRLNIVSESNRLNVVLLTVSYSPGGSFFCYLDVKEDNPPPIPPPSPTPNPPPNPPPTPSPDPSPTPSPNPPPTPNCNCGYTNPMRIVGGTETGINEYPMMAGLVDGREKELFCGATIISPNFALTAAHCIIEKKPRNVGLLVGDHDISVGNDTNSAKIYLIKNFYMHPNFNSATQRDDVALVAVKKRIEFNREVGPACLPFLNSKDSFAGETVHALGWGTTEFGGPASDKLLKAPLNVITLEQCKPTYGDLVTERQMCTYMEDKDACQSDSGGPLLWKDPNSNVLKVLGIISYGIQCATTNPSVNTRVTSYLDWIIHMTGEDYCII